MNIKTLPCVEGWNICGLTRTPNCRAIKNVLVASFQLSLNKIKSGAGLSDTWTKEFATGQSASWQILRDKILLHGRMPSESAKCH